MRMLFIGGTRFVGRAMAEAALVAGHGVSVLHRGRTGSVDLPEAEHLLADRDADLSVLCGRTFDATIDVCAYLPRQVASLADALGDRGGHHVYVSTMSVYADDPPTGFSEDAPLAELADPAVDEVTNETYGGLKVLCERAAVAAYGAESVTLVRPTYVVGPRDYTFRFPRWVRRIAAGGEVLAAGPTDAPVQVVDARDLGAWTIDLAASATPGAFNGVGTGLPFTFADMLDAIVEAVAPKGTALTWVDAAWLVEQGVDGPSLPLWDEGRYEATMTGSNAAALATGLLPRPLAETARDTLAWIDQDGAAPADAAGMSSERETELLARWHGSKRS